MIEKPDLKAEKAKQLSIPSRHLFRLLLPIPVLVSLGFVGNLQGWIGSQQKSETQETGLLMTVPDAKVNDLPKDRKYEPDYGGGPLSKVNGIGITLDDNSNINSRMISGDERNAVGIEENDLSVANKLASEMGAGNSTGKSVSAGQLKQNSQQKKINAWNKSNARQQVFGQQVNSTVDQMYRNPTLSQTEKEEQAGPDREEEQRLRANEKLLELLDKQIQQQGRSSQSNDSSPLKLPNSEDRKESQKEALKLQPYVRQVIASSNQEFGNAFYGLNGIKIRSNRPLKVKGAIRAVVHGEGEGITVTNGSTVSLRMQEETTLVVEGESLILPENTLVYGEAKINGDRIYITVSTIRLDNYLYPVSLDAYDLDGQKGLSVPDMKIKQQISNTLIQGSSQLANPGYIVGGTVGQQVGGQLATQGISAALNAGKNLLARKSQQAHARIRPNYQILLRTSTSTDNNQTDLNETESSYE